MEIHAAALEAGRMSQYIMGMGQDITRDSRNPSATPATGGRRRRLRMDKEDDLGI